MLTANRHLLGLCTFGLFSLGSLASAQDAPLPTTDGSAVTATPAPTTTTNPDGTVTTTSADATVAPVPEGGESSSTAYSAEGDNRYHVDTTTRTIYPNRYMLAGGSIMLVAGYLPGAIVAASKDYDGDKNLYYPVAGPWMYLARHDHSAGDKTLLVLDGIVQDLGALEILLSFVIPEREERRWYEFGKNDTRVRLSPRLAQNQGGLWAYGRF